MERGFSPHPHPPPPHASGNLLMLVHWKLVQPVTPSGRENELAFMKACPVRGCVCVALGSLLIGPAHRSGMRLSGRAGCHRGHFLTSRQKVQRSPGNEIRRGMYPIITIIVWKICVRDTKTRLHGNVKRKTPPPAPLNLESSAGAHLRIYSAVTQMRNEI